MAHAEIVRPGANRLRNACRSLIGARRAEPDLASDGYQVVRGLLGRRECREILAHETPRRPVPADGWPKGRAAADPFYARLVRDERFLAILRPLLGSAIVQWGVDIIDRQPGTRHPWHSDIESSSPDGGFVSIWIGLANTSAGSGLGLISRSHLFGCTLQEEAHRHGMKRGQASDRDILGWARRRDPSAELAAPELGDGDALIFDGRLWHGSSNSRSRTRTAMLLQYARSDRAVRMFDPLHLGWPLRLRDDALPPVIVVSGAAASPMNLVVPDPSEPA